MGCCIVCTPTSTQPLGSTLPTQESSPETLAYVDPYAIELQSYALALWRDTDWREIADLSCATISSREESKYSRKVPVLCIKVKPIEAIDLSFFVKMMVDAEERKKWDYQLSEYKEVTIAGRRIYYTLYEFPFPFKNREFCEAVTVLRRDQGVDIIKYSTEDSEIKSGLERASTMFYLVRAEVRNSLLDITMIAQIDLSLPFKQKILFDHASSVLEDWVSSLVSYITFNRSIHTYE